MGIKAKHKDSDISDSLNKFFQRQEKALVRGLTIEGEKAVNTAKETGSYTDQTGVLRSANSYVVAVGGEEKGHGRLEEISGSKPKPKGVRGSELGYDYAKEIAKERSLNGVALVLANGAPYSAAVEAKGYTVQLAAVAQLKKGVRGLKGRLKI